MANTTNDSPALVHHGMLERLRSRICSRRAGARLSRGGDRARAEVLAELIAGHEGKAIALALDVTKPDQIKNAVSEAERVFGGIDVLVNNAGYGYLAAVEEGEDRDIRALFETNFFGLAALIRAVLRACGQDGAER